MVGNDIVDLFDPDAQPRSFRPGFDERVFAAEERRAIGQDPNPLARRWAHWAAKEAAYKLARQIDETFVFSPGRLVANYDAPMPQRPDEEGPDEEFERRGRLVLSRAVGNSIRVLEIRSFETSERVHVVAVPADTDWSGVDFAVERLAEELGEAAAVRTLATREIGRLLGVVTERISIGRRGRIPTVEVDGSRISLSISLSHHGRWIGVAMRRRMALEISTVWTEDGRGEARREASRVCPS